LIAEFQKAGRACEELTEGIRVFPADKYFDLLQKGAKRDKDSSHFHGWQVQKQTFKNN
jgi:hypothetical protein